MALVLLYGPRKASSASVFEANQPKFGLRYTLMASRAVVAVKVTVHLRLGEAVLAGFLNRSACKQNVLEY